MRKYPRAGIVSRRKNHPDSLIYSLTFRKIWWESAGEWRRLTVINRCDSPSPPARLIYHACSVNSGNAAEEPLVKSNLIVLLSRPQRPRGVVTLVADRVLSISLTPINRERGNRVSFHGRLKLERGVRAVNQRGELFKKRKRGEKEEKGTSPAPRRITLCWHMCSPFKSR